MLPEVTNKELAQELAGPNPPFILDVREAYELEHGVLPQAVHIPMIDVPDKLSELDKDAAIVVVCRTGSRSSKVTDFLVRNGYSHVRNLVGGMNAWSADVDPSVKAY